MSQRAEVPGRSGRPDPPARTSYSERLRVPLWWHPSAVLISLLFADETASIFSGYLAIELAILLGVPVFVELVLWRMSRGRVRVHHGYLEVGDWRLPVAAVLAIEPLDRRATKALLRDRVTPGYRYLRTWVPTAVCVSVDDPGDAPQWLFSSRHPAELTRALVAARAEAVPGERAVVSPAAEPSAPPG